LPRYTGNVSQAILKSLGIAAVLALAACGAADSDPGAGGVSTGDAKALDKAAQDLDERDKAAEAED
jgi:hypothetical protein